VACGGSGSQWLLRLATPGRYWPEASASCTAAKRQEADCGFSGPPSALVAWPAAAVPACGSPRHKPAVWRRRSRRRSRLSVLCDVTPGHCRRDLRWLAVARRWLGGSSAVARRWLGGGSAMARRCWPEASVSCAAAKRQCQARHVTSAEGRCRCSARLLQT